MSDLYIDGCQWFKHYEVDVGFGMYEAEAIRDLLHEAWAIDRICIPIGNLRFVITKEIVEVRALTCQCWLLVIRRECEGRFTYILRSQFSDDDPRNDRPEDVYTDRGQVINRLSCICYPQ
jgi:hypothetical protein